MFLGDQSWPRRKEKWVEQRWVENSGALPSGVQASGADFNTPFFYLKARLC
jgi:hypothetical protein